jgi:hypothetical protein
VSDSSENQPQNIARSGFIPAANEDHSFEGRLDFGPFPTPRETLEKGDIPRESSRYDRQQCCDREEPAKEGEQLTYADVASGEKSFDYLPGMCFLHHFVQRFR